MSPADPEVQASADAEAARLRKKRGRVSTLLAGASAAGVAPPNSASGTVLGSAK